MKSDTGLIVFGTKEVFYLQIDSLPEKYRYP